MRLRYRDPAAIALDQWRSIMALMTSDRDGGILVESLEVPEAGQLVPAGTTVKYLGHIPGGMVRVELPDGRRVVMHPHAFPNLR